MSTIAAQILQISSRKRGERKQNKKPERRNCSADRGDQQLLQPIEFKYSILPEASKTPKSWKFELLLILPTYTSNEIRGRKKGKDNTQTKKTLKKSSLFEQVSETPKSSLKKKKKKRENEAGKGSTEEMGRRKKMGGG